MTDRIMLRVLGQNGYFLEDQAAELVGGLAVSHKHRMAFGSIQPSSFHQQVAEDEGPPQIGVACIVYLEDEAKDLKIALRQYGPRRRDRIARYVVMGPPGSWVGLLSASIGLSIGFWPVVHSVSEKGSCLGLAFLFAWTIFYIPVIARSVVGVFHREWAFAMTAGILMYMAVFVLGGGCTYSGEGIWDILNR